MSFFPASHRPYDAVVSPDFPRVQMAPLSPYDNLPTPQMQSVLQGSAPHPPNHTSQLTDRTSDPLPKVGQTRCYWALLSSNLHFLYLDPVLASHLEDQAGALLGKSLLSFVHPDEQTSAQQDLGGVLESRTLHGSVTRVRYSRLSRVRRMLGYTGSGPDWVDANKIALDDNYMAVDIVINWAADGVVLCFIHAVVDLEPRDNDEHDKTGWTNWCGTPSMSMQQVDLLFTQLVHSLPQPPTMERVFQILLNEPERPLWFSWPSDRQQVQGGPVSKDFARLAAEVSIGNTSSEAKTSCTRRYKALQTMQFGSEGTRDVESIFIPYGSIIFACHKVAPPSNGKSNGQYASNSSQYYNDAPYNLPPLNLPSDYPPHGYPSQQAPPSPYPAQNWSNSSDAGSQPPYSQWTSQHTPISSSPSVSSMRSSTYATSQHPHQQPQTQWSPHPSSFIENNGQGGYPFPPSVPYNDTPSASSPATGNSPALSDNVVPAPRNNSRRGSKDSYTSGGRSLGNPPVGIMKCSSCSVTHSPEWRKGPSGKKDLCNACGLRYARSRAKKEGGATRRKKEKVLNNMSSKSDHSPSASPVNAPFNGARRSSAYDEVPFQVSPHPGHEPFIHPKQSPSPPSSGMGSFTSYHSSHEQSSQGSDHRGHVPFAPHPYYSIPPGPHDMSGAPPILPRLDAAMSYPARLSPSSMHSPPSPAPSHFATPSYEREVKRERDHDRIMLPPTPISADGRGHGKF